MQPTNERQKRDSKFPLFKHPGGQWAKKVQGRFYYFGAWKNDPKGERALAEWIDRREGIATGLDRLRVSGTPDAMTLAQLMKRFLENRRNAMVAGELSAVTYGDYLKELPPFVEAMGGAAQVASMTPTHYSAYGNALVEKGLGRHARRRKIAYCKAMINWGAKNGFYPTPTYGTGFTAPDTSPDAMRQAKSRSGQKDHSRRILTGKEIDSILCASTPLFKAITLMAVNCGLGPADLGRLRWRHLNLETGVLDMARGKTGTDRKGYVWKRTRKALARVAKLKHNKLALEKEGQDAFVFLSRTGQPMYRESEVLQDGASIGVTVTNAISDRFGKIVRDLKLEGVSLYRLRHTFKTLGKRAKDHDALNLAMGHREGTTGEIYDHEDIEPLRIKRVALAVLRGLWPRPKQAALPTQSKEQLRIAG